MAYLCHLGDPLTAALAEATELDEPLTDGEHAALHEARVDLEAGQVVSDQELRNELNI